MRQAISVSQLNMFIKDMFTQNHLLYNIMVKGEISNFKESNGNYYFVLKDEKSSISAIIFYNKAIQIFSKNKNIKDGSKVILTGNVKAYDKNGTYSFYVESMEEIGLGEEFVRLNELKKELYEKGMFDKIYKVDIPKYSMNIGVVTAKTGAAIEDIKKTIKNKNPYAKIYLYSSKVQGDDAYKSIIDGIITLDKMNLDVIIIGRGGGSIEDLYCYNDVRVAYTIFNATTPIISAVGHQINESISDLVADINVATPTAAGEISTFSFDDLEENFNDYLDTMLNILENKIENYKNIIEGKSEHLKYLDPKSKIIQYKTNLNNKKNHLNFKINNKIKMAKIDLEKYFDKFKNRDVLKKIENGFAYVKNEKGNKISTIKDVKINDIIKLRLKDGEIDAKINKIIKV